MEAQGEVDVDAEPLRKSTDALTPLRMDPGVLAPMLLDIF
jgi:hypothetical protein